MKEKKKLVITPLWERAQLLLSRKELELADDVLMTIIWRIARYTQQGYSDDFKVENVKIGVWKERAWVAIETNGLLPR